MIQTYIKLAYRNFIKNKSYGFINLLGLTVGLLACFLVLAYVQYETGFDKDLESAERIYQVNLAATFGGDEFATTNTPPPVGKTMQENFPEVADYTRIYRPDDLVISDGNNAYTESQIWAVDSNFLQFFSFPLLMGNMANCLKDPRSMVLTKSAKQKYFGEENAVGKTLKIDGEAYQVSAVLDDLPRQSSLQFDMLLPVAAMRSVERFSWSWVWVQMETYVRTPTALDTKAELALEAKFPTMVRTHAAKAFKRIGQDINEFLDGGNKWELSLRPIEDVHLYSAEYNSNLTTLGNIKEVYIFGFVGLMILLLAGINFININTARSADRAKEVGVRKVLGSDRKGLIGQFLAETVFYSLAAAILAIALTKIVLPAFNQLIGIELQFSDFLSPLMVVAMIGLPIIVGLLAGSYPALVLANFRPATVLKSKVLKLNSGINGLRSGLVVFQFAVSVGLIACTLIVLKQINYALHSDIGLQRENVLIINNAQRLNQQTKSFKENVLQFPEVTQATISTDLPAGGYFGDFYVPDPDENTPNLAQDLSLGSYLVDDDFIPTMEIELVNGRNFDALSRSDSATVILNETAVKTVGWENPIGKWITYPGNNNTRFQVIGVMKDFNMFSFRESVIPFGLFHESSKTYDLGQQFLAIRVPAGQEQSLINKTQTLWQSYQTTAPFEYTFLDDNFNSMYQSEARLGSVLSMFTFISIFIACLGLFGLISYHIRQRTREVGIRRVLGASITNILTLLTRDLLKLVVIGVVLAIPFAWYLMQQWLQDFQYRVEITGSTFLVAGVAAIFIAIGTVSWLSVKAALANPVQALKEE